MRKFSYRTVMVVLLAVIVSAQSVFSAVSNGYDPSSSVDVPTISEWGMIGSAVVLGAAGLYSILKRK